MYVNGSEQVTDKQSLLGGGGGRTNAYAGGGVLILFNDEPIGEILGGRDGTSKCPDRNAGDGAGTGAWINLLFGEEKGGCGLRNEGP